METWTSLSSFLRLIVQWRLGLYFFGAMRWPVFDAARRLHLRPAFRVCADPEAAVPEGKDLVLLPLPGPASLKAGGFSEEGVPGPV